MKIDERAFANELAHTAVQEHGAAQDERELASLIFILRTRARKVRRVLEIGVYKGGTLWLWQTLWPNAAVVGIDDMTFMTCGDCELRRAHNDCPFKLHDRNTRRSHMLYKDSSAVAAQFKKETFDILHIDGDHSAQGVRKDWNNYAPVVKKGTGLIIVHDVVTHDKKEWGVAEFWDDTLSQLPGAFVINEPNQYGFGVIPC